uniref:NADH-ubiquinone oxidoreductase chain 5 n=1 Tax=Paleosuchus palpebrosus TaxID=84099 RepID=A7DWR3_PALPA|nr:NADH dehydrogenase subunit 5 [Paleosuchus palpebrosus]AIN75511.1 NADH dehydrogenase subunit 5 [Paleosuchus palpebrosus]QOI74298.1 NADH dehydrogenase subunit 5 [Paleosuchus palpebrosus]CAM35795.1 NADH dehydrogenase subunit 5 [Paleosuchus palpebrosus]
MSHTTLLQTFSAIPFLILLLATLPLAHKTNNTPAKSKTMMAKLAFFTSLPPLFLVVLNNSPALSHHLSLFHLESLNLPITLKIDTYSTFFIPTALFITWSIMEFSKSYMDSDPKITSFFNHLLVFILMMMILVSASNLFHLFIGWEGVGIMSYLLINWWSFRANANKAALQAIIYNRLSDIGILTTLTWMTTHNLTLDITNLSPPNYPLIPAAAIILAAAGKSAQIGLHPWLPAAMEGPTPVSALLHSSTMVVAGVFLLIRTSPIIYSSQTTTTACLILGAITSLFAAACAFAQNDMKKIIAFSTSSQLGLMVTTIGLKQPELAFLHILMHAFFKAMLFLCAGSIIHSLNNEQDFRKMGNLKKAMPITTSCLTIGVLALTGTPFLSGFYSKDAIIESLNTSHINAWALAITLLATSFTAIYSLRMVYFTLLNTNRLATTSPMNETPKTTNPILRLAIGSVITGLLTLNFMLPTHTPQLTMPTTIKLMALTITAIGMLTAMALTLTTDKFPPSTKDTQPPPLTKLMFFNPIIHHLFSSTTLHISQKLSTHLTDQLWYETLGPKTTASLQTMMTKTLTPYHKAKMKKYLKTFLWAITITLLLW